LSILNNENRQSIFIVLRLGAAECFSRFFLALVGQMLGGDLLLSRLVGWCRIEAEVFEMTKLFKSGFFALQNKAAEGGDDTPDGYFKGIVSVFGNVDDGGDVIMPGAFQKTIMERAIRIKGLWQHDTASPPIGKTISLAEVGRDELPPEVLAKSPGALGGLQLEAQILPTSLGNDVLIGMRAGAINEMSFGFEVIKDEVSLPENAQRPLRVIREVRLWEWSPVNWGMNSATHIGNVKALEAALARDPLAALNQVLKQAGDIPPEVALPLLAEWLGKAGRVLSATNVKKVENAIAQMGEAITALEALLESAKPPQEDDYKLVALTEARARALKLSLDLIA
jgi:HK97 family phage prohead protease